MTTFRKVIFSNQQIYHIFNKSIEGKTVFSNKRGYARALLTLQYYRFANLPLRLSKYLILPEVKKKEFIATNTSEESKLVEILAYCLMPNHFHFLLEQKIENGISSFIGNFTNSYTKYFNTKNKREGPLFKGIFEATWIENDEQLIHVSRYIHLNPVSSFLISQESLESYPWSSISEYLNSSSLGICNKQKVLGHFPSPEKYKQFLYDQISYAQDLEMIKHLIIE